MKNNERKSHSRQENKYNFLMQFRIQNNNSYDFTNMHNFDDY